MLSSWLFYLNFIVKSLKLPPPPSTTQVPQHPCTAKRYVVVKGIVSGSLKMKVVVIEAVESKHAFTGLFICAKLSHL